MPAFLMLSDWTDPTSGTVHPAGTEADIPDEHRERLLRAAAIQPLEGHTDHVHSNPVAVAEPVGTIESGLISAEPEKPKKAAAVDEWREYAVAQGFDRDQVEDMTKAELVAAVG